ncbi:MAG: DedA family protein [Stackebrandtia sp.]
MWPEIDQLLASPWAYAVVMALILCDVYLPVLPSGTSLIVATVYAHAGATDEFVLLGCAAVASTVGDWLAFRLAARGSGRIRARLVRWRRVARADDRLRATLRQHTGRSVVFARFIPAGRCLVTLTCGSDPRITSRRFQPWSALAAVCWAAYTVGLGYLNVLLFHTTWVSAVVAVTALFTVGTLLARSRLSAELR